SAGNAFGGCGELKVGAGAGIGTAQRAVPTEDDAFRCADEAGVVDDGVDEGAAGAVVAFDGVVVLAVDPEVAVGAEGDDVGAVEAVVRGEHAHRGTRPAVVAQDAAAEAVADVEVAVGAEGELVGVGEGAAGCEDAHGGAGGAVVASDLAV